MPAHPVLRPVLLATTALALLAALPAFAADDELVRPQHLAAPDQFGSIFQ